MPREKRTAKNTGSIYQKNGYYVAQVMDGYTADGKPHYRQAQRKSHADAVKAKNELLAKVTAGVYIPDGRAPKLADWLDTWLEDHVKPNKEPKTYDFYKLNVEKRIKPKLGRMDLRKIRSTELSRFFRVLETEGASKSTVSATRRTLRAAMSVAVKHGLCTTNPVTNTEAPTVRTKETVHFDRDQANALLKALHGSPIENLVRFTLATGLRMGEATGLTWESVDLDKKEFRVHQQLQRIQGKLTLKPLKTEKSRRTMPLIRHTLQAIQDEKARQTIEGSSDSLGLVFLNPFGRAFDPKYVDEKLKEALVKAKLPATGMHSLRHSAATFMLMAGLNMHQVSRYLGHSQIALTSNLYGHVLNDAMREAAEALQRQYNE